MALVGATPPSLAPHPTPPLPHSPTPRATDFTPQNQYQARIDQAAMEANFRALAQPRAGGLSLAALGYTDAGLDDGWQLCNQHATPANPHAYHTPSGAPVVDTEIFPDFAAMNRLAHSLNLTSGWCKSERALFPAQSLTDAVNPTRKQMETIAIAARRRATAARRGTTTAAPSCRATPAT